MATYVIGDIHGCYAQFTEMRERIEKRDPDAVFILIGDIVYRGKEEEKMLDWAYRNITPGGKYQMVLGNHDDAFIEVFGDKQYETIYSLGKMRVSDDYSHLDADVDKLRGYAAFLAGLPLQKAVEANGQKYIIAHAWYGIEEPETEDSKKKDAFRDRYRLLWERDIEENGDIVLTYKPEDGEKLIHGHTPTINRKYYMHRGCSPGKVWDMGTSVNIDCGLVFKVINYPAAGAEYGNLAAYCLETGEAEYLWDISDGYAADDGEYYEDRQERERREREEKDRKRREAIQRTMPYQLSFYKQALNLDQLPEDRWGSRAEFNFLNDYFGHNVQTELRDRDDYSFDFDSETVLAFTHGLDKDTLYVYSNDKWYGVALDRDLIYKVFKHNDKIYALGVNNYEREYTEITVTDFYAAEQILSYKMIAPRFYGSSSDADKILSGDAKLGKRERGYWHRDEDEKEEPLGLVTCDFYNYRELFTVKILKSTGDICYVRVLDSRKNIVAEIRQRYY